MYRNLFLLIFVTILLLQVECRYNAETTEKGEEQSAQIVTTTQLPGDGSSPRQKLINNGLKNFSICAEPTLRYAQKVFKDVITDVLAFQNQTEEFNKTVLRLQNFLSKIENLNTNEKFYETFELMYELRSWISLYTENHVSSATESSELDVFKAAFEKSNVATLQREYKVNFAKYLNVFYKEFDAYWSSLTTLEKVADTRFNEWYQELRRQDVSGDIIWLLWSM